MSDYLGKAPGLEVRRASPSDHPGDTRVMLDFFTGGGPGSGPFVTLTVMQWTVLQQLARSITWPQPPAA